SRSLMPFVTLYDHRQQPLKSSGFLDGKMPHLPAGVYNIALANGDDRVTWQPHPNIRIALIVMRVQWPTVEFVAVGRSLKEVEMREANLFYMTGVAWLICCGLVIMLFAAQRFK